MKPNHPYPKLRGAKRGRKKADLRAARTTLLNEPEAMAKVTWLYYHRKLTQEQVAHELGLSRPVVMRLLRQATEEGLVTLSLRADVLQRMEASAYLAKQFNLREI